jgi:lantibiotic modifying enzyme
VAGLVAARGRAAPVPTALTGACNDRAVTTRAEQFVELGEQGWRWVLEQVRWDDQGPWVPVGFDSDAYLDDSMYDGVGGLAYVLAELRLLRAWTDEEQRLADGIAARLRAAIPTRTDPSWCAGLAGDIGVLEALDAPGSETAFSRLLELRRPDGWGSDVAPWLVEGSTLTDVIAGTAGILLSALRVGSKDGMAVAHHAADVLLAEAEPTEHGLQWLMAPRRWWNEPVAVTPNFSHGTAGVATALALAGRTLGRPELVEAAAAGAAHLVAIADTAHHGFEIDTRFPPREDQERRAYGWCHGPTGTSYLFAALELAGVADVADDAPGAWHRRCLTSVVNSGLPMRIRPGFWDNDGRCCGTAGVGEAFLDSYQRQGDGYDLAFAETLGLALQERAIVADGRAWWRFTEHRNPDPLLPAGIGWMQGVAGIAAHLVRLGRVMADPGAPAVQRNDNWWALPG